MGFLNVELEHEVNHGLMDERKQTNWTAILVLFEGEIHKPYLITLRVQM